MHLLSLGGLYAAPELVEKALVLRNDGTSPYILDVGTGSGVWAREMAQKFPQAQVIGIDLNPVSGTADTPTNCKFYVQDVTSREGLKNLGHKYDIVHIRALENGIRSYKDVLDNVAEVLCPEGLLLLASVGMCAYDEQEQLLSSTPAANGEQPSALACLFSALRDMFRHQGRATDALLSWSDWLNGDPKWEGFGVRDCYNPLGPWQEDGERPEKAIGNLTQANTLGILDISEKMLIQAGSEPDVVKGWVAGSRREIETQEPRKRLTPNERDRKNDAKFSGTALGILRGISNRNERYFSRMAQW
ncbi:hypothetical protein FRB90_011205 [Tulasnella sp. 427]|nr:hypothetical protein FRB90_011205 [Tulasnella sp. 427]